MQLILYALCYSFKKYFMFHASHQAPLLDFQTVARTLLHSSHHPKLYHEISMTHSFFLKTTFLSQPTLFCLQFIENKDSQNNTFHSCGCFKSLSISISSDFIKDEYDSLQNKCLCDRLILLFPLSIISTWGVFMHV